MIEWEEPERKEEKIPIRKQCHLLSISRSTAYYRPLGTGDEEIHIKNLIDKIYTAEPTYGARRISNTLRTKYGIEIGRIMLGALVSIQISLTETLEIHSYRL